VISRNVEEAKKEGRKERGKMPCIADLKLAGGEGEEG